MTHHTNNNNYYSPFIILPVIQERDSGINGCDDSSDSDDQESCEYLEEGEFEAGRKQLSS